MAKYISLDAVLAEIEKIIADETESIKCFERRRNVSEVQRSNARIGVLTHLRSSINTLDVKEMGSGKEQVASVWHDTSEEPKDMSHCLICYKAGDKVTYMDIIPVLYNKDTKEFVSHSYPHATDNKIAYGSIEGHGVVNVFKNMRDRYPLAQIDKWAYIVDVLNVPVGSKEPVSEDLEEAAKVDAKVERSDDTEAGYDLNRYGGFIAGGNWQKEHLWKPADGNDLPEIDKEVIALIDYAGNGYYKVVFAHRPDPERKVSTNLLTGKKSYIQAKTYDKGGWNIPNVKWWLDVELPKEKEP